MLQRGLVNLMDFTSLVQRRRFVERKIVAEVDTEAIPVGVIDLDKQQPPAIEYSPQNGEKH